MQSKIEHLAFYSATTPTHQRMGFDCWLTAHLISFAFALLPFLLPLLLLLLTLLAFLSLLALTTLWKYTVHLFTICY